MQDIKRHDELIKVDDLRYGCVKIDGGKRCWDVRAGVTYFIECNDERCAVEIHTCSVKLVVITDAAMEKIYSVERIDR
jgi:hypothetical protein